MSFWQNYNVKEIINIEVEVKDEVEFKIEIEVERFLTLASPFLLLSILLLHLRTFRGFSAEKIEIFDFLFFRAFSKLHENQRFSQFRNSVGPVKQQIFDLLSFTRILENRSTIFGTRACDWLFLSSYSMGV